MAVITNKATLNHPTINILKDIDTEEMGMNRLSKDEMTKYCIAENSNNMQCDNRPIFEYQFEPEDMPHMNNSILTNYNNLCFQPLATYPYIVNSFLIGGFFVGGSLFGLISDRFGRRTAVGMSLYTAFLGTGKYKSKSLKIN